RRALELATQSNAQRETLLAREYMGELELDRGAAEPALRWLEPALAESSEVAPKGDMTAELETRLGLALLLDGRTPEAKEHLLRGVALAEGLGDRIEQSIAGRGLARLAAMSGNLEVADMHLGDAIQCFEQLGEIYELALSLMARGELLFLAP